MVSGAKEIGQVCADFTVVVWRLIKLSCPMPDFLSGHSLQGFTRRCATWQKRYVPPVLREPNVDLRLVLYRRAGARRQTLFQVTLLAGALSL